MINSLVMYMAQVGLALAAVNPVEPHPRDDEPSPEHHVSAEINEEVEYGRLDVVSPLRPVAALSDAHGYELVLDDQLKQRLSGADHVMLRDFALEPGRLVDLELVRMKLYNERTTFVLGTDQGHVPFHPGDVIMYRGQVTGESDSRVFLSMFGDLAYGHVIIPGQASFSLDVARDAVDGRQRIKIRNNADLPMRDDFPRAIPIPADARNHRAPETQIDTRTSVESTTNSIAASGGQSGVILDMALDGDYGFYQDMGSDASVAAGYMVSLLGASAAVYEEQISVKLWLTFLRVWTVDDPLGESLSDFTVHWIVNLGEVNRDHAHKITNSLPSGDGIAWIFTWEPLFCNHPSYAYAVTKIDDPFVDEVITFSQELGHNCGSVHTHCYDPPLDTCFAAEPGCYAGPTTPVVGTIMSYCSDADPVFHDGVVDYMRPNMRQPPLIDCLDWARTPGHVATITGPQCQTASGTAECPWLSVEDGVRGLFPGGVLNISPGTYFGPVTIDSPGTYRTPGDHVAIIGPSAD